MPRGIFVSSNFEALVQLLQEETDGEWKSLGWVMLSSKQGELNSELGKYILNILIILMQRSQDSLTFLI
jgi:hypothetical protein